MSLRRFVILAVVLALTFTTGMAVQAGGGKGKVMKLDTTANVVVLEDGSMYRVAPDTVFIVEEKPVKFDALRLSHDPPLTREEAVRRLERQRQSGRRPCRCIDELIG